MGDAKKLAVKTAKKLAATASQKVETTINNINKDNEDWHKDIFHHASMVYLDDDDDNDNDKNDDKNDDENDDKNGDEQVMAGGGTITNTSDIELMEMKTEEKKMMKKKMIKKKKK